MKQNIFDTALITGADGMIGSYVDFGLRTNHRSLDVTDLKEVLAVCKQHKPKLIVHLAAETDLDRCERDIERAYMVNAVGTYNMATAAREVGAKLVYVSTSGIFDGKKQKPYSEEDIPRPQSQYGHSKYLGEIAAKELCNDALIVRIAWVFGGGPTKDQKFVAKIIRQLQEPIINVVKEKYGSPTYGKDLITGIKRLVVEERSGIYHMGNEGAATRADVVREIVRLMNSKAEIREVDASFLNLPQGEEGFHNESMISKVAYMRPWREALKEYIQTEWQNGRQSS